MTQTSLGGRRPSTTHAASPAEAAWRFPTPFGPCGLRWSAAGVRGLALDARELPSGWPAEVAAPPVWIAALAARLQAHLTGHPDDLRDVPLDLDGLSPFARRVLLALRQVPPGETTTYAGLAARAGAAPGAARAVGAVMARNPLPLLVPCHRVLARGGRLGGFSAPGGLETKRRLLALEGGDEAPLFASAQGGVSKRQGSCTRSR